MSGKCIASDFSLKLLCALKILFCVENQRSHTIDTWIKKNTVVLGSPSYFFGEKSWDRFFFKISFFVLKNFKKTNRMSLNMFNNATFNEKKMK